MIPQHLSNFRAGKRVRFGRRLGPGGSHAMAITWSDGPHLLVRRGWGSLTLVSPRADSIHELHASCETARLRGAAVSPSADAIVALHEHPSGARLATFDEAGERSAVTYPDDRVDLPIATNGKTIVVSAYVAPHLSSFDWSLRERRPWPLERLKRMFDDPCDAVPDLRTVKGGLLVGTWHTWSRWSWEGDLLDAWPRPRTGLSAARLVAWDDRHPLLLMPLDSQSSEFHLVEWDLLRGTPRTLGVANRQPVGARSPEGVLLIDRVRPRGGRHLEVWESLADEPTELLAIRRKPVHAISFSPVDCTEVALATSLDFFTMTLGRSS